MKSKNTIKKCWCGGAAEVELLKKELKKRKKYGLVWEEKPEEVVEMCKEKLPVLKEVKNKEIITDKDKPVYPHTKNFGEGVNLLIEGDNYHALSVLNYTHAGKVDVIYIDPPYNTGNKDFIFNDHYVDREDAYRHSKWLAFMEKRLKLAKNLLKDTGVIFISIDDNEVAQLKLLMDQIFGEKNLVSQLIVISAPAGTQSSKDIAIQHSYCLFYKRSDKFKANTFILEKDEVFKKYNQKDFNGFYYIERLWKRGVGGRKEDVPSLHFPIYYNPKNKMILIDAEIENQKNKKDFIKIIPYQTKGVLGRWTWSKAKMIEERDKLYVKKIAGEYKLHKKVYLTDSNGKKPYSIIDSKIGRTELGSLELKDILNKKAFFYPKSIKFIKHLLKISTKKNSVVLDFMAGTGTTGHAVLELNKEDGGNRQFILCTNNENNICTDVCYPRIKKVIEGYKNLKGEQVEGLGGNLKYFRTEFVDAKPSDKNKIKLTHQATEMLCVKEGTFEKVIDNERFKIFKNSDHYTGIIWDQTAIPEFKKAIKDIKGKFSVYVFSLTDETFDDEFEDIKQKVKLSPIPEAILRVYRRIFK
jgi:adenine-specific DNA-methyltransferase